MLRLSKRTTIFLVIAIVFVVAFGLYSMRSKTTLKSSNAVSAKGASGAMKMPLAINATVVNPTSIEQHIYATGTILANEEVELRSEIAGRITSINFSEGSAVQKGALLVKINDADLKATLKKLQVQEALAIKAESRAKSLLERKLLSDEEYDDAQSKLQSVQAEIERIKSDFAKTEIYAPFSGVVGLRSVSVGSSIAPANLIARVQQIDPVKIEFTVPEKYAAMIGVGKQITFTTSAGEEPMRGKVYAVEPKIDMATRTLKVRAIAPNSQRSILPGAFAKVTLSLHTIDNALSVPTRSIIPELGGQKVFLFKNGSAQSVKVQTGIRSDSTIEITSGLAAGDTIITTGALQLRDGAPVKISDIN